MNSSIERCELAPGFSISRVLTGLWQIADMERHGRELDLESTASQMAPYVDAGFTTFDMADHYGSAEDVAGRFLDQYAGHGAIEVATKWVPRPGPITRDDVRVAVERALGGVHLARHGGDHMVYVGKGVNLFELRHVDRGVAADPPQVVALKVDNHYMLGPVFDGVGQLKRQR